MVKLSHDAGRRFIRKNLPKLIICLLASLPVCDGAAAYVKEYFFLNVSGSMPRGVYFLRSLTRPKKGTLVILKVPPSIRTYSEVTPVLKGLDSLLKRVVATTGDMYCVSDGVLRVEDKVIKVWPEDSLGNKLPHFSGCYEVADGEVFVLGEHERSFDSRYFGAVSEKLIRGRAVPVLTM